MSYFCGIDLGGTQIKVALIDQNKNVIEKSMFTTDDQVDSLTPWKETVANIITSVEAKYPNIDIYYGLCAPGLADSKNTCIAHMPGRMSGLEQYDWSSAMQQTVHVLNDGHAACLAEYELYYQKTTQHLIMFTLGTGVGGGCILNGQLYQGALNRAGHFGHICLDINGESSATNMVGSLEQAIGNMTVPSRSNEYYQSTQELVDEVKQKDPFATAIWHNSIKKLACGVASMINVFSPEVVVIGGGISKAGDDLFDPLNKYLSHYEWRPDATDVSIIPALLGSYSGAIGAAIFSYQRSK